MMMAVGLLISTLYLTCLLQPFAAYDCAHTVDIEYDFACTKLLGVVVLFIVLP